jgi:hypothetical protein
MTPTQAEAKAYAERMAKEMQHRDLLTEFDYFAALKWLAVGYESGLIAGRKETADVFADTVQTLNGEAS